MKKIMRPISGLLNQTCFINGGFITWFTAIHWAGRQQAILSRQVIGSGLPVSVANHGTGFASSCTRGEPAIFVIAA